MPSEFTLSEIKRPVKRIYRFAQGASVGTSVRQTRLCQSNVCSSRTKRRLYFEGKWLERQDSNLAGGSKALRSGRLVEAARIELASEAASRKTSTSVVPVLHLTCPAPVGPDPNRPVAVLSPPDGRDARRERVSGVYVGHRSC